MTHVNCPMYQLYIADDNAEFAEYVATVARSVGWSTVICENGQVLLDRLNVGNSPAFLLVDIMMPEVDGIDAVSRLAELDRPLRVRFLTGGEIAPIIAAKMMASAHSLSVGRNIFKPISMCNLKEVLRIEMDELSKIFAKVR